jgi:hypothetical protein
LIGSLNIDDEFSKGTVFLDEIIDVVTYKSKTVQNVLAEIAGLLVLLRLFTFILSVLHEKRFISKMNM